MAVHLVYVPMSVYFYGFWAMPIADFLMFVLAFYGMMTLQGVFITFYVVCLVMNMIFDALKVAELKEFKSWVLFAFQMAFYIAGFINLV